VETDDTAGMAQFLAHAAFKNTSQRSAVKFAMDIEDLGGEFSANATRESVTYSADVLKGSVSEAVGLLAETALDSQFQPWTVETIRDGSFQVELDARLSNVTVVLSEALHAAAFYDNSSLGQPLFSDASGLDADSVGAFVAARRVISTLPPPDNPQPPCCLMWKITIALSVRSVARVSSLFTNST
jgi:predicted Zn-dependent peptidase